MDSKERHELMTNELSTWISNLPQTIQKNRNQIIGAALIIIGLISWPILNNWRQKTDFSANAEACSALDNLALGKYSAMSDKTDLNASVSLLVVAKSLEEQAQKAKSPDLAALALIKRGQALRSDIHFRKDAVSEDIVAEQTKQAEDSYRQAQEKATLPSLKAMAQFGLGLCAEELGQVDQAKEIYQKIAGEKSFAQTPLPMMAQKRIADMADNTAKYTFIEKPAPATTPEPAAATPAVPVETEKK